MAYGKIIVGGARGLRPVLMTQDFNAAAYGHAESPICAENVRIPPGLEGLISFNKKPDTRSLSFVLRVSNEKIRAGG
jgi:hypothetical protein